MNEQQKLGQEDQTVLDRFLLRHQRLVWASILSLFAVLSLRCLHQSVDDMYIIFRYVENVVNGHGFVFNVGERVEGFTSFLWVVVLSGFVKLGIPVDFAAKALSVAFGGLALWLLYRTGRELWRGSPHQELLSHMPVFLLAVNPAFEFWVVGGLATMPYAAMVIWSVSLLIVELRMIREEVDVPWSHDVMQATACSLAMLTRPEGAIVAAFVGVVKIALWRFRSGWLKHLARFGALVGVVVLSYVSWRWWYYGALLPNTYYAKMGGSLARRLMKGWEYLQGALSSSGLGWLGNSGQTAWGGALLFFFLPLGVLWGSARRGAWCIVVLASLLLSFVAVWEGGDWMPFYRFLVPAVMMWMLMIPLLFDRGWALVQRVWPSKAGPCVGAVAGALVIVALWGDYLRQSVQMKVGEMNRPDNWPAAFAQELHTRREGVGVLALSDIGLLSYLSKYHIVDMVGLVDKKISRAPGPSCHKDYDVSYVLDKKPDFIVLNIQFLPDKKMRANERFQREYEFIREVATHSLFQRKPEVSGQGPEISVPGEASAQVGGQ